MVNLYSHMVIMMCIYWREKDVTDYQEFLVLFHLHYFLQIADIAIVMIAQYIYCNLNLLKNTFINSLKLDVKTEISIDITNIWKNIYNYYLQEF